MVSGFVRVFTIVRKLINQGYTKFISTFSEGTDLTCASIVDQMKKKHKGVILEAVLPHTSRLTSTNKKFVENLKLCDEIYAIESDDESEYPNNLNYHLVSSSDILVAVWDGRKTGVVFGAIEWANILKKEIIIIPVEPYLHLE